MPVALTTTTMIIITTTVIMTKHIFAPFIRRAT
jgi:hypothetical protein